MTVFKIYTDFDVCILCYIVIKYKTIGSPPSAEIAIHRSQSNTSSQNFIICTNRNIQSST